MKTTRTQNLVAALFVGALMVTIAQAADKPAAALVGALGAIISHAETVETRALSVGIPVT